MIRRTISANITADTKERAVEVAQVIVYSANDEGMLPLGHTLKHVGGGVHSLRLQVEGHNDAEWDGFIKGIGYIMPMVDSIKYL